MSDILKIADQSYGPAITRERKAGLPGNLPAHDQGQCRVVYK